MIQNPNMNFSKLASTEMERKTLCCCLVDPRGYARVMSVGLKTVHFFEAKHKVIFDIIQSLGNKGLKIDLSIVSDELSRQNHERLFTGVYSDKIGKEDHLPYLAGLYNEVATAAHAEQYAKVVKDDGIRRSLVGYWDILYSGLMDSKSPSEIIADGIAFLTKAQDVSMRTEAYTMPELVDYSREYIVQQEIEQKSGKGITTGISLLDTIVGGLKPGLIIIGARPSLGKTDLGLNFAQNISLRGNSVGFISAEMSKGEMMSRVWSLNTKINRLKLFNATMEKHEKDEIFADKSVSKLPIYWDFSSRPTAHTIRARLSAMKANYGIRVAIIDHLQMMGWHTRHKSELENWREIPVALKEIGRDLDMPIILIAQLSRGIEYEKRKPRMSDLREAGEEPVDTCLMLWRKHYQSDNPPDVDELKIHIVKSRNGKTGMVKCRYDMSTGHIGQAADQSRDPEPDEEEKPKRKYKPKQTERTDTGHGDEDVPF